MNPAARPAFAALLSLALASAALVGCGETTTTSPTDVTETPPEVLTPTAPGEATSATSPTTIEPATTVPAPTPAAVEPEPAKADSPEAALKPDAEGEVALLPVKFDEMMARIEAKDAKLTLVDAWATWCTPCKENFPHLVQMHQKYVDRGLAVVSLSLDDPLDSKALDEAKTFLREQKAVFTNFVLDEEPEEAFNKLDVSTIPAVFLFGPDGKEIRRFTMDDPNNQFTYDEVEKTVAGMLDGATDDAKAYD